MLILQWHNIIFKEPSKFGFRFFLLIVHGTDWIRKTNLFHFHKSSVNEKVFFFQMQIFRNLLLSMIKGRHLVPRVGNGRQVYEVSSNHLLTILLSKGCNSFSLVSIRISALVFNLFLGLFRILTNCTIFCNTFKVILNQSLTGAGSWIYMLFHINRCLSLNNSKLLILIIGIKMITASPTGSLSRSCILILW